MYLKNKFLLIAFVVITNCVFSKNSNIEIQDSLFRYQFYIQKQSASEARVYVNIVCLDESNYDRLKTIQTYYMFNRSSLQLKNQFGKIVESADIIVEDFVHSLRLVGVFFKLNPNEKYKFLFNNQEINLSL